MSLFRTEQLYNLNNHRDKGDLWKSFSITGLLEISYGYALNENKKHYTLANRISYMLDWKALLHMTAILDESNI